MIYVSLLMVPPKNINFLPQKNESFGALLQNDENLMTFSSLNYRSVPYKWTVSNPTVCSKVINFHFNNASCVTSLALPQVLDVDKPENIVISFEHSALIYLN